MDYESAGELIVGLLKGILCAMIICVTPALAFILVMILCEIYRERLEDLEDLEDIEE